MTKARRGGTELFAVRFPVATLAAVRDLSGVHGMTVGALIVELVEGGLDRRAEFVRGQTDEESAARR